MSRRWLHPITTRPRLQIWIDTASTTIGIRHDEHPWTTIHPLPYLVIYRRPKEPTTT